ncbi:MULTISPECIES: GNAT family N-acetyltransferase [unclassified Amycolatopsis]|uniref:GNAT family N-acetyltransferase n=1 Tax=unclassified Amycolatopsis TaxID=2618356 RepID=UPI002875F69F|nr:MULTISPECIES: GNAT family N-acetyltransferase [unclassified Amycolatopsis]MDS0134283.1 GNAT family N-acetyltransferase [Amycolatopsis sp. 505]MDS0149618.1 GNAT family N-acetyltransferase [Amycolatopsis sp. CM201R]
MDELPVVTERLIVRRFEDGDVPAFGAYRSDPEVARYQSWDVPVSPSDAGRLVAEFAAADEGAPGWFQYAVELRDGGGLAGDVGVCVDPNRMQAELGFTIAREHQRRGYATEAAQAVLDRLFGMGIRRVSAECDARNKASARLLDRLGFRPEGHRRRHTWLKGEWTDDLLFGLLPEDRGHSAELFACRPNLLVRDLAESVAFYVDLLGFRVGWRWSDRQGRFLDADEPTEAGTALVARDQVQIMLTQVAGSHTTRLHLDVPAADRVDRLFLEWSGRGAEIAEPPFVRPWGMYEMRLLDPDGNVLRVSSPPAH